MSSSNNKKSPRKSKTELGRKYENLAGLYFTQHNYRILEKNWRAGKKEIDLIVQKENLLIFVEVKSSSSKKFGHPSERVDTRKIKNLTEAARQYIISNEIEGVDLRFDVVTFVDGQLEHYENAFEAAE